jgi:hypothetical protein
VVWWAMLGLLVVLWFARGKRQNWRFIVCFWLGLGVGALCVALWFQARDFGERIIARSRNFYGTLRVGEYREDDPVNHYLLLEHGRITHGLQFTHPDFAKWPSTYYGEDSGLALGLAALPAGPRRIGVVGLGVGTTAAYGRSNDVLRIYEINAEVLRMARTHFTYLSNCPSKIEVALGDARLSLEHESPQQFDLLALDAFSSDAIPVHLLTREAFELYLNHVNPNGVIAVHISNRYLDLQPVLQNVAAHFKLQLAIIDFDEPEAVAGEVEWLYSSTVRLPRRRRRARRPFRCGPMISRVFSRC